MIILLPTGEYHSIRPFMLPVLALWDATLTVRTFMRRYFALCTEEPFGYPFYICGREDLCFEFINMCIRSGLNIPPRIPARNAGYCLKPYLIRARDVLTPLPFKEISFDLCDFGLCESRIWSMWH